VLVRSARENDPNRGVTAPGAPVDPVSGAWLPSSIPGKRFSHLYGYGVANAQAAVDLAKNWSSIGGSSTQKSCGPYNRTPNVPLADARFADPNNLSSQIIDGAPGIDRVDISDCQITKIEFVEVVFSASHSYPGDLEVWLRGPNDRVSALSPARICGQNIDPNNNPCASQFENWRFGSVRHLDEAVNGAWQLEVTDRGPEDTGTFKNWSVTFWGR
jgi:proprotein convertase subtilisin/kexin type 2